VMLEQRQPDGSWVEVDLDGDLAAKAVENSLLAEAKSATAKAKLTQADEPDTDDEFTRQMLAAAREE
jgi:hypothetical protein